MKEEWGELGTAAEEFNEPSGVAVDAAGSRVYVVDHYNHRIQRFDAKGDFTGAWGAFGVGAGQFNAPSGIAISAAGNVYVADTNNNRIQAFDPDGRYLGQWGAPVRPYGVAVDPAGAVYVSTESNRVQKFTAAGGPLLGWDAQAPRGVAAGPGGVHVAGLFNHLVQTFNGAGTFGSAFGGLGDAAGQLRGPDGVAVSRTGEIYVADRSNHRVQVFSASGAPLDSLGRLGDDRGRFDNPSGVAMDCRGNLYVTDRFNHRVQKFSPDGDDSRSCTPAPSAPATPAPTLPGAIDRTPPTLRLTARRRQRALHNHGVFIRVRCSERCRIAAGSRVKVALRKGSRNFRARVVRRTLRRGATVRLKVRFSDRAYTSMERSEARGARMRALVTVRATDGAGNSSRARRQVRFVR